MYKGTYIGNDLINEEAARKAAWLAYNRGLFDGPSAMNHNYRAPTWKNHHRTIPEGLNPQCPEEGRKFWSPYYRGMWEEPSPPWTEARGRGYHGSFHEGPFGESHLQNEKAAIKDAWIAFHRAFLDERNSSRDMLTRNPAWLPYHRRTYEKVGLPYEDRRNSWIKMPGLWERGLYSTADETSRRSPWAFSHRTMFDGSGPSREDSARMGAWYDFHARPSY